MVIEKLRKLYDPADGQMRMVGLMSGSGSNLRKILEFERQLKDEHGQSPFKMVAIFSNRKHSNAVDIAVDYDLPAIVRGIKRFYIERDKPLSDMITREEYDQETVRALAPYEATVAVFGGYMSVATKVLRNAFLGVNVHPADLSILDDAGQRKYTGDDAVRDALLAGEPCLRSSTHIIEEEVDGGQLLMISRPLEVDYETTPLGSDGIIQVMADACQEELKEVGDWDIFPKTLLYLAEGRYAINEDGVLHFDGKSILNGLKLEVDEKWMV
jgi:folate-dependent phosphoribosylglycinamide formyltransferase PurN